MFSTDAKTDRRAEAPDDSVEAATDEEAAHVFAVNFFGPLRVIQAALPLLRAQMTPEIRASLQWEAISNAPPAVQHEEQRMRQMARAGWTVTNRWRDRPGGDPARADEPFRA